jgi:uncharacterized tellurite resistance protein B-like protein
MKSLSKVLASLLQREHRTEEDTAPLDGLLSDGTPDEPTAYAVLLSDIDRIDGDFTAEERASVEKALGALFPNSPIEPTQLIRNAEGILDSFRGTETYLTKIKAEHSTEERRRIFEAVAAVIKADGAESGEEAYLEKKLKLIL